MSLTPLSLCDHAARERLKEKQRKQKKLIKCLQTTDGVIQDALL